jgi:hypothetical protein
LANIYLVWVLFLKKTMHDPMFSQEFLGKQGFSIKKIKLLFVITNKFWKFKWYPRKVTIHLEKPEGQLEHHEMTSKPSLSWKNNEKSFCIFPWKKAKLTNFECMCFKWGNVIFDSPLTILKKSFVVPFWV